LCPAVAKRILGHSNGASAAEQEALVSRLNYLAIMCEDPTRMRDWYQRWFGFEEFVGLTPARFTSRMGA